CARDSGGNSYKTPYYFDYW
nr:immunoglobulin heavy chain junction region [Macaca mulatta]MPN70197.1 immunoglobulin heavy chain junction region [Macaca mulatta]MPN73485.1 immunoglobulin heavy chain junction region [Macaca mulatta]MPN74946.1 immunoglobulin heavy chain junction region [Macaca mulatta]MPN75703.1 immunoglobulin heavy chain junction region [Macaca mulatta]